jgi:hypothetical protein
MYECGRLTVAFAQGNGGTIHNVSATTKLDPKVRKDITIQAAQMLAETSDDHMQKLSAIFFLNSPENKA